MRRRQVWKQGLLLLAALLLAAAAALPGLAASEKVEAVVERLEELQRVNIDPEWLPDIRAGESSVQALLDAYLACSAADREAFTTAQNRDLRAYFEALYEVQGKDPQGVDDIFAGKVTGSSSSNRPVSSSGPSSSAASTRAASRAAAGSASQEAASSLRAASSSAVSNASGTTESSIPAGASVVSSLSPPPVAGGTTSLPSASASANTSSPRGGALEAAHNPPQIPKGNDRYAFLGMEGLGSGLLFLLGGLMLVVFLRFLASLRGLSRPRKVTVKEDEEFNDFDEQEAEAVAVYVEAAPPDPADPGADALPGTPADPGSSELGRSLRTLLDSSRENTDERGGSAPSLPMGRRTGRPPKMPFRQGDPDDLDAIDD